MNLDTIFSPDRGYRYVLRRDVRTLTAERRRVCMFIGLNPSTADERQDDPTIRRCIDYARRWGYDVLIMTNLFAYRATQPANMKKQAEPIGAENDRYLLECAGAADLIVAAWGRHGNHLSRDLAVAALLQNYDLRCFGRNKDGSPKHPLMQPKSAELEKL